MRKLPFFLILFLIVSLLLTSTVTVKVKAQEIHYTLDLNCDKSFYWKGDTIQVNVTSNSSVPVTLRLYWNWKTYTENQLIYQDTKTANASWNLPTSNQKVGFYRIVANTSEVTITTWRTLIHRASYEPASLPFSYVWDQINYTFQGRTLRAETERDYLEIKYPKIPFEHSTDFYRNNMSFAIRLKNETQGWKVDIAYFLMHGCLKWFVNGTLQTPKTFDFKLEHNPLTRWKKQLDSMRGKGLVYDWSDIRKMKQAFVWNKTTKILSVMIPENFFIDPTIFEDGFEGQDSPPWSFTSTGSNIYDPNCTTVAGIPEGSEVCNFTKDGSGWEVYAYEDFGVDYETLYTRAYFRWTGFPAGGLANFMAHRDTSPVTWLTIGAIAGNLDDNWTLRYRYSDTLFANAYSDKTASADTWYCVEILTVIGNGDGKSVMWIDGVETLNQSSLDNDGSGTYDIHLLRVGENYAPTAYYDVFVDAVVCDNTTYIGLLDVGDNYYEWPDINLIFSLSSMRSFHLTLPFSINLRFLMSSSQFLYELFQWNPTINLRFIMSGIATRLGFTLVNPSINLRFILSSMQNPYYLFQEFHGINLRLIMSSTSQAIIGLFNVNPTINLRIILNSARALIAHYWIVSPVINLIFNLASFSIIPTVYTINDAIMIGAIAFIIAICGVVIAVTKRD